MKKIILTYGGITGLVIILSMTLGIYAAQAGGNSFLASEALGYSIMIIGFSMIFVATKKYRDEELGGVINFKTALKIGLGISLIAGIVYVIVWEINLYFTDYAFIHEWTASQIQKAKDAGMTGEQLQSVINNMEDMKDAYGNILYRLPMTFSEIFPIGLIISLISSALFKNPNFLAKNGSVEYSEN